MPRLATLVSALSLAACTGPAVAPPSAPPPRAPPVAGAHAGHAIALGYTGAIDTDVQLGELALHDYTLTAWVLPEVPHAYEGPIFAASEGGAWSFGQGDYRWGKGGFKREGAPVLQVIVGASRAVFAPKPDLVPGAWRHVALVRRGVTVEVWVDGARAAEVVASDDAPPRGTLRIGRRARHEHAYRAAYEGQFYGAVDDVVVYTRALDDAELAAAARPGASPKGNEPGLVAAFTYDDGAVAPALAHPYRLTGRAAKIDVSAERDGTRDLPGVPLPALAVPLHLPFDVGQAWQVIQGNCAPGGSHNGYACFSWDLVLAGAPIGKTRGRNAHASGPGVVVGTQSGNDNNWVKIRHAPEQFSTYMHLLAGSVRVTPATVVPEGEILGFVGDTGAGHGNYHLHFSVSNGGLEDGTATIPSAFTDYEVSDDRGKTWRHVDLGVPTRGQWVRRSH